MSESAIAIASNVTIMAYRFGDLIWSSSHKNHIGARGRTVVSQLLRGTTRLAPRYIAVGTGTTAVGDSDLALATEVFRRKVSRVVPMDDMVRYSLYVFEDEANDLADFTEIGLFSGTKFEDTDQEPLNGGRLFARALITPVSKDENTTLSIVWDIGVASAT